MMDSMKFIFHFFILIFFSSFSLAQTFDVGAPDAGAGSLNVGSLDEPTDELPFEIPRSPFSLPETALVETTKGSFVIKFYRSQAPISVANFVYLAKKGFYDGVSFHRFVEGFMIQGGDPSGTAKGGPGWTLPPELRDEVKHKKGSLGWARLHADVNPLRRSNGSQFYIVLRDAPDLDGFYTVFAQIVRGYKNAEALRRGDRIIRIRFPRRRRTSPSITNSKQTDSFAIDRKQSPSEKSPVRRNQREE